MFSHGKTSLQLGPWTTIAPEYIVLPITRFEIEFLANQDWKPELAPPGRLVDWQMI